VCVRLFSRNMQQQEIKEAETEKQPYIHHVV